MNYTLIEKWEILEEFGVSNETIRIVTYINGYNDETLNDILYVVTGYRDFEQLESE